MPPPFPRRTNPPLGTQNPRPPFPLFPATASPPLPTFPYVQDVNRLCARAAEVQKTWAKTSFAQRRLVMRTIQRYIVSHQEDICRVCARDSGKPKVDALLGEVMTTCKKIRCINANGEGWLKPDYRPTGPMMMHKTAYVKYLPYGVLGVIAPWNYPFHNMLNHVISGLFSGNAVVTKVSEHTSWSAD